MTSGRSRTGAALAAASVIFAGACFGEEGEPAAPVAADLFPLDASFDAGTAAVTTTRTIQATGTVTAQGGGVIPNAIVVAEVGGIGRTYPAALGADGGPVASFEVDPFVQYAAATSVDGDFGIAVPEGTVGLYFFAPGYFEKEQLFWLAASHDAGPAPIAMSLQLQSRADGGGVLPPTLTGLSASPVVATPLSPIVFVVQVSAGSPDDPLSEEVFLVDPSTNSAGALAPPAAALSGGPYPDGPYNRVIAAPEAPGTYEYFVVAASMHHVAATPASIFVSVTPAGAVPYSDAGSSQTGLTLLADGGLPAGRH
jgi:hypothetical protein